MCLILWGCISIGSSVAEEPADLLSLHIDETKTNDLRIQTINEGVYLITTTGSDPYLYTLPFEKSMLSDKQHMLAFEYICPQRMEFQVFFAPSPTETGSIFSSLPPAGSWTAYSLDLNESNTWNQDAKYLRLDFGKDADRTLQIRNLCLRRPTAQERRAAQERSLENQARLLLENGIRAYLKDTYPCQINQVTVSEESIEIKGTIPADQNDLYLCEVALHQTLLGPHSYAGTEQRLSSAFPPLHEFHFFHTLPGKKDDFTLRFPRFVRRKDFLSDRLFSRWLIGRKDTRYRGSRFRLLSHARWADEFPAQWHYPAETPKTKKGIGALGPDRPLEDLDQLGIGAVTVNIVLNELILPANQIDAIPYELNGKTYFFNPERVENLDRLLQEAAQRDIIVAAIILIKKDNRGGGPGNPAGYLAHPKCEDSAVYAMANVTRPEGVEYCQAVLDFLANRYGREDKQYGRIHHWILHNEIDMGVRWTNAGHIGPLTYMDLYHKSMRIAYLTARKYNPNAKIFIPLTHYWNWTPDLERGYLPRQLLEIMLDQSRTEGDFQWAIAHHPYPQSLFEPKTWLDRKVNFTFETALITPKNIEVLDAWVKQKRTFYNGQTRRTIWLSEQGLNSPDYSEQSLAEQAAGMAYFWKKLEPLDSIETFVYHNWVDNQNEDGLLLGLRMLPSEGQEPKPIWYLYKALETPDEDAACDFAKGMIGIENWDQIRYTEPILETNLIEY